MGSDEQALRELHTIWIAAVNAGDLVRLLTLMTDHAMFLYPGREPVGKDEFPSGFTAAHQLSRILCVSVIEELVIVGEVAHTVSRDTLSVSPRDGGELVTLAGHRITIYHKQPDGQWRLARDANTLSPIPT